MQRSVANRDKMCSLFMKLSTPKSSNDSIPGEYIKFRNHCSYPKTVDGIMGQTVNVEPPSSTSFSSMTQVPVLSAVES
jgi:hypothetical protein